MNTRRIDDPVLYMQTSRAKNRVRSDRQRSKLLKQGKASLTVWIDSELRQRLNDLAVERNATIGDTAESLLRDGLNLATREHFDDAADRIGAALTTAAAEVEDLHAAVVESGDRFRRGVTEVIQRQRDEAAATGMLLPELTPVLLEDTEGEESTPDSTTPDPDAMMREISELLSGKPGADIVERMYRRMREPTYYAHLCNRVPDDIERLELMERMSKALSAGLNATTPEPSPCVVPTDTDTLMREVAAMLDSGISGADIVERLNTSGRRTTSCKLFTPGNLLSCFRRWQAKQSKPTA